MDKNLEMRIANNISATDAPTYLKTATTMMLIPVDQYIQDITEIKQMLRVLLEGKNDVIQKSDLIDIKEASTLLKTSISTLYKLTAQTKIPFSKRPGSNKLLFSRDALATWVKDSRETTLSLVDDYLHRNERVSKRA